MDAKSKIANFTFKYGVEAVNLCIDRHNKSTEKRQMWSIQFIMYKNGDPSQKQDIEYYRTQIDELTKEINKIDEKLLKCGINEKERKSIIRAAKEGFPENWSQGFSQMQ